jgi:hypothetical protein
VYGRENTKVIDVLRGSAHTPEHYQDDSAWEQHQDSSVPDKTHCYLAPDGKTRYFCRGWQGRVRPADRSPRTAKRCASVSNLCAESTGNCRIEAPWLANSGHGAPIGTRAGWVCWCPQDDARNESGGAATCTRKTILRLLVQSRVAQRDR